MINEENLNKLYDGVVNGIELTTKQLNDYGFNSKDLSELIEKGCLERVKRGYYSFISINDLFCYGKWLIAQKEYEKANKCFKKCYEIDSKHPGVCFQLFLNCVKEKEYENAFKYFDVLEATDNPYYSIDMNFYLYLLNIITDIPDKYKEYARYLKIEDVRVDFSDKRYSDIQSQNRIRYATLQRKFAYAIKQYNDLIYKKGSLTVQDVMIKILLSQAAEVEKKNKDTLTNLAKNKSYEKIIEYLEEKQKRYMLSLQDECIKKLANKIIDIKNNVVLEKTIFQTENLFEAIDGNNYELAYSLNEKFSKENNINISSDTIGLLLLDICDLNKIYKPIKENVFECENKVEYDNNETKTSLNLSSEISFTSVISFLLKSDLEKTFRTLKTYMESINKKDYEFLIVDLIKISLIEKDLAFTKPMLALTYISREKFEFDISNYIQEFYIALSQNKFDEARIYLDIISKSNKLGQECILIDSLLQVINNEESLNEYKKDNKILDDVENAYLKSQSINNEAKIDVSFEIIKQTRKEVEVKPLVPNVEKDKFNKEMDNDKKFIESKHKLLLDGEGIVLLRPMNEDRIENIFEIVKNYQDMVAFCIGEDERRQVVLRYKPYIEEYVDIKRLKHAADLSYGEKKYDECIEICLKLLQIGEPKSSLYAKLGLSYMKKWNKDKAIDYLTIATSLSKKEDNKFDFTELIASLNGLIDKYDKKPRFSMKIEDFQDDTTNYYDIDNFDEIASYILENDIDVESACKEFNMTDEQIDNVKLIYAREFYSQGNYEKGDQFLKSVEKSKNKTSYTLKNLEEIRHNKKFYINRQSEKSKKLSLTLKPKK